MASFSLVLDAVQITQIRSDHTDTDYVSLAWMVNPENGLGTPQVLSKSMGNLKSGIFPVGLSFPGITVNPSDTLVFNYLVVNCGGASSSDAESAITSVGIELLSAGSGLGVPQLASALQVLSEWLYQAFYNKCESPCDGTVAVEQDTFSYAELVAATANGPCNRTTEHPGNPADAHTCGSGGNPSIYFVNWHMFMVGNPANKTVPDVLGFTAPEAARMVEAAGLIPKFTGQNKTGAWVLSQSPAAGTLVGQETAVTMYLDALRTP